MEMVNIKISRNLQSILVKSSEGQQIEILDSNKELKASDVINFLNYSSNKKYILDTLEDGLKNDKNVISIYEIFKEIFDRINPVEE